jgi:hypothetical protein
MTAPIPLPATPRPTPPTSKADRLPIIIAAWPRNSRKIVRISLDRFNTCYTIDIRCWWRDTDSTFKPSRAGLTLAVRHLPQLVDGLGDALQRARVLGLVEHVAKAKGPSANY